jgi:DNA-directed RNA polymerase subunit L
MPINIKTIAKEFDTLIFNITDKSGIEAGFINALRRGIVEIPVYSFAEELMQIDKNTSIDDNDIVKHRLSLLPITNLKHVLEPSDIFEMRLSARNSKEDNIDMVNITTDHCKFYLNGKEVKRNYKDPFLLFRLKRSQEIRLTAKAMRGSGKIHTSWLAGHSYYKEIKNGYQMTIESSKQLSANHILRNVCDLLVKKLGIIEAIVDSLKDEKEFKTIIKGENTTLGNLLIEELLNIKDVEYASAKMDHPLKQEIVLYVRTKSKSVAKHLRDTVEILKKKLSVVKKAIKE